ncbi:MAG: hypothetical protein AAFX09_05230 [Pseudomonadota bacterium]
MGRPIAHVIPDTKRSGTHSGWSEPKGAEVDVTEWVPAQGRDDTVRR